MPEGETQTQFTFGREFYYIFSENFFEKGFPEISIMSLGPRRRSRLVFPLSLGASRATGVLTEVDTVPSGRLLHPKGVT